MVPTFSFVFAFKDFINFHIWDWEKTMSFAMVFSFIANNKEGKSEWLNVNKRINGGKNGRITKNSVKIFCKKSGKQDKNNGGSMIRRLSFIKW